MGDEGGVAGDDAPADGVGERAADDEVDLVDGLRCETRVAIGGAQQLFVERLEMMWSQPPQPDPPERRHDAAFDVRR